MAKSKSVLKRERQNEKRRRRNQMLRSRLRTALKAARQIVAEERVEEEGAKRVLEAARRLDKSAAKGVIHKNQAARKKARLMRALHRKKMGGGGSS